MIATVRDSSRVEPSTTDLDKLQEGVSEAIKPHRLIGNNLDSAITPIFNSQQYYNAANEFADAILEREDVRSALEEMHRYRKPPENDPAVRAWNNSNFIISGFPNDNRYYKIGETLAKEFSTRFGRLIGQDLLLTLSRKFEKQRAAA